MPLEVIFSFFSNTTSSTHSLPGHTFSDTVWPLSPKRLLRKKSLPANIHVLLSEWQGSTGTRLPRPHLILTPVTLLAQHVKQQLEPTYTETLRVVTGMTPHWNSHSTENIFPWNFICVAQKVRGCRAFLSHPSSSPDPGHEVLPAPISLFNSSLCHSPRSTFLW